MNMSPDWFRALHPTIQALVIVCCCGLVTIAIISHDATTNLVSILMLVAYFRKKS